MVTGNRERLYFLLTPEAFKILLTRCSERLDYLQEMQDHIGMLRPRRLTHPSSLRLITTFYTDVPSRDVLFPPTTVQHAAFARAAFDELLAQSYHF